MNVYGLRTIAVGLLITIPGRDVLHAGREDDVLSKLRSYDDVYVSQLTAEGTMTAPPPWNAPHMPLVDATWLLTLKPRRLALFRNAIDFRIRYMPESDIPASQIGTGIWYDAGDMMISVVDEEVWSLEADRAGWLTCDVVSRTTADGRVSQEQRDLRLMIDSDDSRLMLQGWCRLWGIGRSYSHFIDEVTTVRSAGGNLEVHAIGNCGPSRPGEWELTVDPDAQWIVRTAQFHRGERGASESPLVSVSNRDVVFRGAVVFPRSGQYAVADVTTSFTVDSVTLDVDTEVLRRAANRIDQALLTPGTLVDDYTVVPTTTFVVPDAGDTRGARLQTKEHRSSRLLVVAANIVLVAIWVLILSWRRIRSAR